LNIFVSGVKKLFDYTKLANVQFLHDAPFIKNVNYSRQFRNKFSPHDE